MMFLEQLFEEIMCIIFLPNFLIGLYMKIFKKNLFELFVFNV